MTTTGPSNAPDVVDVVALGESMVTFMPSRPGRLADVPSFDRGIGGAESNVACVLAAAGHSVRWVSRVGADGFGDHLVEEIGAYGVDVSAVRRDPVRPTGVYFRTAGDRADDDHEVAYYRAGSAASAMATDTVDLTAVRSGRILHLSGITAALSGDCLRLLRELTARRPNRPLVSFDVNHRVGLWRDTDGPRVLLELARGADIVFVGEDEAEEAWGITGGAEAIREALPEPGVLVVKQGERGATLFGHPAGSRTAGTAPDPRNGSSRRASGDGVHLSTEAEVEAAAATPATDGSPRPASDDPAHPPAATPATFVPALQVDVVATVGAGDAFAAGFLSATLRQLPVRDRLRHGHLWAAAALTTPGDLAPPPTRDHADRLVALDDDAWGRLRLGPGWTQAAQRAEEEVRTP
ncbi:2-dehydro-3-deoxygluconokinase [Streptomyces sp. LBL]|uniref:sugar kinase n=1 Tax=Streptomyces sp. LBL TaxID=2940562 RepID=UPI002475907F|nr:sugar kinase [Streptomyces sp. LBL]MDH6624844.1 2-dehydro-3-deoxygluconokinase [Streptomyces sp. LBL]